MVLTKKILPIMKEAAKLMLSAHSVEEDDSIGAKSGDANFVTVYDKATQDYLISEISKAVPGATFVAEEQENDFSVLMGDYVFVIDPIDGTTNFIHGYMHSSISVACVSSGEIVFGAVYNPYLDEMFYAERGCGAFLNERKISVSERDLKSAVCCFGTSPYYKDELADKTFSIAKALFLKVADIRRLASAALDLCYIAAGRADMFFELRLSPWDFAAGALIITEAGGVITDFDGNPINLSKPCSILAASKAAYPSLFDIANG